MMSRREFVQQSLATTGAIGVAGSLSASPAPAKPRFRISLAQWSLHRAFFAKQLDNLDFAKVAKEDYGVEGLEYVNQFFKDKAKDMTYLKEMKKRAKDYGLKNVLIMCDGEGSLGAPDEKERIQAVENHYKWVEAAKFLGCHSIRVNAYSKGTAEEQMKLAADGLRRLVEFGDTHKINVIVENHGGHSSHGDWLTGVMKMVNHPRVGTLPDFGNFYEYDRYKGVEEMMLYAKGVSAKSHVFDAQGNEAQIDYPRMIEIVRKSKYKGFIGIEYEGDKHSEADGIRFTKKLLDRILQEGA